MTSPAELFASLHPLEGKVLAALDKVDAASDRDLVASGVITAEHLRTVIEWQLKKGGIEIVERQVRELAELAETGREYLEHGVPELRLLRLVEGAGTMTMAALREASGLDPADAGTALGQLRKAGLLVDAGPGAVACGAGDRTPWTTLADALVAVAAAGTVDLATLPEALAQAVRAGSRKRGKARGIFRITEDETRRLALTALGRDLARLLAAGGATQAEASALTPEMLKDGSWQSTRFRRYNIALAPPRHVTGKRNPYRAFLDLVKRKLTSLGFAEMTGPLVETELWNMDALFMPQFHPARAIHDVYMVAEPTHARELPEPAASNVARAHASGGDTGSIGWRYAFDKVRTGRLVLRSQGTALSARWLSQASIPGKYFGIARCFRFDSVDATHAPDFFQVEGIVLSPTITFRELLGLLGLFAREVAHAEEIRFAPAYFPFTEPSVEVHMRHPRIGWMELGGAGIFRPEVTLPQGVPADVPVIAWGLGLDRMAMVALGIDDIRELFTGDLARLRARRFCLDD